MEIDPEQIPEKLPDPETHDEEVVTYWQHRDGVPVYPIPITENRRPTPLGPPLDRIDLKKKRRHVLGLEWRFEYLRWKSGNGTKRRLHAGMIEDAVLLEVIEDTRRRLMAPTELGQRHVERKPEWMPMIEAHFAAVRCVHTIVGWAEHRPGR